MLPSAQLLAHERERERQGNRRLADTSKWEGQGELRFAPKNERAAKCGRRRPPRSPDRERSLRRRRRLAKIGMIPPRLGERFTIGEGAVLYIVAMETLRIGRCDLFIDAIAGRAGVSRSTVKNAIRFARRLGLIEVKEWRQAPDWNGPNTITIISKEWLTWLAHGRSEMTVKKLTSTIRPVFSQRGFSRVAWPQAAFRGGARGESGP